MKKFVIAMAGLLACAPLVAFSQDDVIARAGDASVTQSDVETLLKGVDPRARQAADAAAMDGLVRAALAQKIVLAQAKQKGWDKQPQVQAQIEQAQREIIERSYLASVNTPDAAYPSDAEIQAAYDGNPRAFTVPASLHLAQIYLELPPNADAATVAKLHKQADDLAVRARKGDFAALAKANSQDKTSAANGGDMGFMPEAVLLPAVRQAAATLKPGEVSAPIQTPTGFHVVKLIDTKAATVRPLPEVKEQIRAMLRTQRTQQNAQAYLAKLTDKAPINEDALKKAVASTQ
ncbi:peptidylprolyl isomerase [Paraburkholderia sp. ZP32-5]|uniref:peptidylprolyl isomerase n=1 Tax=Paraburkholderia sp. ZP32-5 TaxID=2883245 RepID=UPI001F378A74|nr:peptidylprolyl isomerase [Paraburkholderia sp. ZP32-5]